jgi:hypothetical protein
MFRSAGSNMQVIDVPEVPEVTGVTDVSSFER